MAMPGIPVGISACFQEKSRKLGIFDVNGGEKGFLDQAVVVKSGVFVVNQQQKSFEDGERKFFLELAKRVFKGYDLLLLEREERAAKTAF